MTYQTEQISDTFDAAVDTLTTRGVDSIHTSLSMVSYGAGMLTQALGNEAAQIVIADLLEEIEAAAIQHCHSRVA